MPTASVVHGRHSFIVSYGEFDRSIRLEPNDIIVPSVTPKSWKGYGVIDIIHDAMENEDRYKMPSPKKPYIVASRYGWARDGARWTLNMAEDEIGHGRCTLVRCTSGWVPNDGQSSPPSPLLPDRKGILSRLTPNRHFSKPLPLP